MARFLSFILLAIVICSGCIANQEGAATPSPSFEASQLPQATNEAEKELGCAEGGMGVHTADDVRCYLAQFPAEFVRPINDEITVLFTNPDSLAEWIGGAVIYHIPSVSTVTLDFNGDVDLRHTEFKDHSATIAFERPLTDGVLMAELKQKVQSLWDSDGTEEQSEFELELAVVGQDGYDVSFMALLRGGEANEAQFYCPGHEWVFGNGFSESGSTSCEAKGDGPAQPIQRVFLGRHIYSAAGEYTVQATVKGEQTNVTSAPLIISLLTKPRESGTK